MSNAAHDRPFAFSKIADIASARAVKNGLAPERHKPEAVSLIQI
jgi:hypothetical protein